MSLLLSWLSSSSHRCPSWRRRDVVDVVELARNVHLRRHQMNLLSVQQQSVHYVPSLCSVLCFKERRNPSAVWKKKLSRTKARPIALVRCHALDIDLWPYPMTLSPWLSIPGELWSWSTHMQKLGSKVSRFKRCGGNKRTDRRTDGRYRLL